jgi:hypothetical protein
MASTLAFLTIVPAVFAVAAVVRAWAAVQGTSLRLAWAWALAATLLITLAWITTGALQTIPSPWDDMLWYGVAELLLCPQIAVLGARRPGVAVWNWFVLLPLLAVLGWPVAAAALAGARPGSFILETPPLVGILLVLLMGTGNYAGTRFRLPFSLLVPCSVVLILISLKSSSLLTPPMSRALAVWCVGAAAAIAWRAARRPGAVRTGPDRVWHDFRDQFGIVWAQRVRERINERSTQEHWPVRLERSGFVAQTDGAAGVVAAADPRIEHTLRWLLRRFVDEAWLNERLGTQPPGSDAITDS